MRMPIRYIDWFLVLPLIAAVIMIGEIDMPREDALTLSSWVKAAALAAITLVITFVVAVGSALDRRCSEEYLFQIMANAALVALAATMLVNFAWVVGEKVVDLPEMASDNVIGVVVFAWISGYYWFRVRGIAQ